MDDPDEYTRLQAASIIRNSYTCQAHYDAITTATELIRLGRGGETFGVEEELAALRGREP